MSAAAPVLKEDVDSGRQTVGRMARTGPAGLLSAAVVTLMGAVAVLGNWLAPHDPNASDLSQAWIAPSSEHLLGFDAQGRDVLSRLLAGARTSLIGPFAVVVLCMLAGTLLAVTAAWRRGAVDTAISSSLDVLFAFPGILLAVLAAAVFGAGLVAASAALAIAYTPYVARVLRGAALKERSQPYVAALEVQGVGAVAICVRHLVPNVMPLIVAQASTLFGYAMVDLAAISFLGLGVQPPNPNWGVMIAENQSGILQGYPLPSLSAAVCIVVTVVAFNVLGERLFDQAQAPR